MNYITFKKAIRLVHPDTNPNITDASTKVATIMANKNDEAVLYDWMVHWSLIKGIKNGVVKPTKKPPIPVEPLVPNKKYYGRIRVKVFGLGDGFVVSHTTKQRVYFTKETKNRTGKTWVKFNRVKITGIRK